MAVFRLFLAIIFRPIELLANLFKHKDNLLEWHLNYDKYIVHIKTKYKGQLLPDGLLVASYILFLARYFRICDERQIDVMKSFLNEEIGNDISDLKYLPLKIYYLVKQTLSETDRHVADEMFFMGEPPWAFYENADLLSGSYSRYSFLVFENGGVLTSRFYMSVLSANVIFLPLTVAILYNYVAKKLEDKSKKQILDKAILDLLRTYETVNCRSLAGLYKVPVDIINQNNVNYKT